jgi:DNA-binding beta-propeller fold protein YncE
VEIASNLEPGIMMTTRPYKMLVGFLLPLFLGAVFFPVKSGSHSLPKVSERVNSAGQLLPTEPEADDFATSCAPLMIPQAAGEGFPKDIAGGDITPVRYVMDPYPTFNGIAIDAKNGRVVMSDSNRKGLLFYERASGSQSREETTPLRQITGPNTLLGFVAGVALDSERGEVYGVNNDTEDNLSVFSYDDDGDLKPKRVLALPHQAWGIALGLLRDELAVTVERHNAIVVYRREAKGVEAPLRSIRGAGTGLADPHGIVWDQVHKEFVVANHGNLGVSYKPVPDPNLGGQILPASITVYPDTTEGDVKPARTITGPHTQLAWPMGIDVDAENNEIAVANNGGNSILIFSRMASGDVIPTRVIRGSRTNIDRPMGVAIDRKNNELWVANFGSHSALVFGRTADGNVAPKRVIRNAPAGTPSAGFGNPMAAGYDTKRQQILVPN